MKNDPSAEIQANESQHTSIEQCISYWEAKVYTLNSDPTFYHRFEDQFKNANSQLAIWKHLQLITTKS